MENALKALIAATCIVVIGVGGWYAWGEYQEHQAEAVKLAVLRTILIEQQAERAAATRSRQVDEAMQCAHAIGYFDAGDPRPLAALNMPVNVCEDVIMSLHDTEQPKVISARAEAKEQAERDLFKSCKADISAWDVKNQITHDGMSSASRKYREDCRALIAEHESGTDAERTDCRTLVNAWGPRANRGAPTIETRKRLEFCNDILKK